MSLEFLASEYELRSKQIDSEIKTKMKKLGVVDADMKIKNTKDEIKQLQEKQDSLTSEINKIDSEIKRKERVIDKLENKKINPLFDSLRKTLSPETKKQKPKVTADSLLIEKLEKLNVRTKTSLTDSIVVDQWTENKEGVTFFDVVFAKEIVQNYNDGKHYKSAKELKESVPSFRGKPVVAWHHPKEKVVTSLEQQVGHIVFDSVKWDNEANRVYGDVFIEKKYTDLIDAVKKKKLEDNSIGFNCDIVKKTGTFNGTQYDYVQENIFVDHLAFVYTGRAGSKDGVGINVLSS